MSGTVTFVTRRGQNPDKTQTLVWLDGGAAVKPKSATAQMVTKSKTLLPHVIAVPVGSSVQFPNEDPIIHNLFSVSAPRPFDLGLYKKGSGKAEKFDKPGIVTVYCNVHPNMSGVIHVMNTPWYTFADAAGSFRIADVPAGKYRLMAWNEQAGTREVAVEVKATGEIVGNTQLTLDTRNYRAAQHLNKHNQPYARSRSNDY